jgi:hypothetical protein
VGDSQLNALLSGSIEASIDVMLTEWRNPKIQPEFRIQPLTTTVFGSMTTRRAHCSCGQLHLTVDGEPSRIWICHCLECQRRTGAVVGNLARFSREQITFNGIATAWKRAGESGSKLTCHFCPTCGSTVYFENEASPGFVAVAIGNFADPNFPAPILSVWETTRHPWVSLPADTKRISRQG